MENLATLAEPIEVNSFPGDAVAKPKKKEKKTPAASKRKSADSPADLFASKAGYEFRPLIDFIDSQPFHAKVAAINELRRMLHEISPFKAEPVDCVIWVPADKVTANDYNPNSVAPPEMKLLEHSIAQDGYTQPIVGWKNETMIEVVDGFHRNRVGKESETVRERVHGYLPVVIMNDDRLDKGDRVAATIRHNRARGKHRVDSMSDIVIELKKRNWSNNRIGKELGMDDDEILRLCQISGLTEVFANEEFSEAWDAAIFVDEVPDAEIELEKPGGVADGEDLPHLG